MHIQIILSLGFLAFRIAASEVVYTGSAFNSCQRCSSAIDHTAQSREIDEGMKGGSGSFEELVLLSIGQPAPLPRDSHVPFHARQICVRSKSVQSFSVNSAYPPISHQIQFMPLRI